MILGVEITNFDVFTNERIGLLMEDSIEVGIGNSSKSESVRLHNLNALIGRNNTGKTSFLLAMSFIRECVVNNVASASTMDGRTGFTNLLIDKDKPAEFKVLFRVKEEQTEKRIRSAFVQYELTIGINSHGSPVVQKERIVKTTRVDNKITEKDLLLLNNGKGFILDNAGNEQETAIDDYHMTALGVYGRISVYKTVSSLFREMEKWFFCRFSSHATATYNTPGGHKHLNVTGTNVNNVLEYMRSTDPVNYDKTIDSIIAKIPAMKRKKSLPRQLEESPDKLFLYLLLLKDQEPNSTIFIETPDKDLYHDMVDVLSDEMRDFTLRNPYNQIIFSTHSPYIVENMSPNEIWIFSRESLKAKLSDGFVDDGDDDIRYHDVSIRCAGQDPVVAAMSKEGVGMGAIWYGGHLDNDTED